MDLEQTLKQVNRWFGERFRDRYTTDFADPLKEEIAETVSPYLRDNDRKDIINYFGRDNILEATSAYIAGHYVVAKETLEAVQGSDDKLSPEDQRVLDAAVDACSRTVRFVEELSQHDKLTPELMQGEFTQVYRNLEEFSNAYLANLKLVIHEATRHRGKDEGKQLVGFLAGLQNGFDEMQRYTDLLISETVRVQEQFLPKVFDQVLWDMYR